ncbi:MAG: OsmC family protein [Deltaproteobacteria bacterium]|nr:OsmC family protein [Deltaproteobacteria bacterium]
MSLHRAAVTWKRSTTDFEPDTYSREHVVTFGGGARLEASAAPEYHGDGTKPNPEEQLVGALSGCHMLTFLAVCARKKVVVDAYDDEAEGVLEKNAEGRLAVTRVTLRPRVTFAESTPVDDATLDSLHAAAHRGCFIASSVKTEVTIARR